MHRLGECTRVLALETKQMERWDSHYLIYLDGKEQQIQAAAKACPHGFNLVVPERERGFVVHRASNFDRVSLTHS